jgi:hypothetical protein
MSYSHFTLGTGMPLTKRFPARPVVGVLRSPFVSRKYQFQSEQPPKLRKLFSFWFVYMFSFGTVTIKEESGGESKNEIAKENGRKVRKTSLPGADSLVRLRHE